MNLKQLINKSVYGTIGYISSENDIDVLEQYIIYNLPVLKEFKQIVVATNYGSDLKQQYETVWIKYFPNVVLITSPINRGHNFGTADLDNLVFDYCKENNVEWLCKASNDVVVQESILSKNINEADFYYLDGFSYETLYLNNFDYNSIYNNYFYPQTNFYIINVSKCDYLCDKDFLDETYEYSKTIPNYNGKIWEYIEGWSCENFLKQCVIRNNLTKQNLISEEKNNILSEIIRQYKIGDPSHKNIMIEGICHFQHPENPIFEI